MRHFLTLVSLGLSLTYVVPLTGFVLLRGVPSDAPWWLNLADTFTLYLFIPTLLVLLLGLLLFSRSILLTCFLPIVLFVFLYGEMFLPMRPDSALAGSAFTIMTHNVNAANPDPQRVVQVIKDTAPDIVAVQELTNSLAEVLVSGLSDSYRYRVLVPREDYSGAGVFSRFPIVSEETFEAGHLGQHLVVDVNGQSVHLFNVHLLPPGFRFGSRTSFPPYMIRQFDTRMQTEQVEVVLRRVDEIRGPVLVAGDFNMTDQTRPYRRIRENLTDVFRETGWGFGHTFPVRRRGLPLPLPVFRIDYVFHSRELVALEAHVGASTGSDHLPLVARLGPKEFQRSIRRISPLPRLSRGSTFLQARNPAVRAGDRREYAIRPTSSSGVKATRTRPCLISGLAVR